MTETPTKTRSDLPPLNPAVQTYLIVDRTAKTQNVDVIEGDMSAASKAAKARSLAIRGERQVFIFRMVGAVHNEPVVALLDDKLQPGGYTQTKPND